MLKSVFVVAIVVVVVVVGFFTQTLTPGVLLSASPNLIPRT